MKTAPETTVPGTLPLTSIEPSPTNPRKTFDPDKLSQLAETIRSHGFLQKLLVRPCPGRPDVFELVDGERRWRAAKQLGIEMLPVDVRDLTTPEVVEIQLIAGDTGEPLTPIEEGHGFKTALELKDAKGAACYTMRTLADKVGCGLVHIQQRVSLVRLPANVQEWVSSGSLAPRTANLLARIPDAQAMTQAIQDIVFPKHREDPLPYKEAEAVIHERYMVSLRGAPFDPTDATTFNGPEGKPLACATCPLKTGNDPERFGDVKDKNVCTNPGCYRAKCNVAWDRAAAKAKAAGQRVLTDEEAAEVFEKNSPVVQIAFSSAYVDVDSKPSYRHVPNEVEDKNLPTWRELISSAAEKKGIKVPIVLARDRNGKQWQLVHLALCIEAARAIGEDMFKKAPVTESISSKDRFDRDSVRTAVRQTDDFAEKKKAEADATKMRTVESCLGMVKLHDALSLKILGHEGITDALFATALHHASNDGQALFAKAFGLPLTGGDFAHSDAIDLWFHKRSKSDRHAAIPVLLIAQSMRWKGLKCEGFTELAASVKLDVAAIEKEAAAQLSAKVKLAKVKTAAASAPTSAAVRPKGRELSTGELKELAEKYAGKPAKDIASRFGISVALAKWYATNTATLPKAPDGVAAAGYGLSEGRYIAVKTLLVSGKSHEQIADQLKITVGQVGLVASREKITPKVAKPIAKAKAKPAGVKKKRARIDDQTTADIRKLTAEGLADSAISAKLSISLPAVFAIRKKFGIVRTIAPGAKKGGAKK